VRCAGLPVDFQVEGTPCPLAPGIDVTAYRIVQEALTNTMRHAPSARATVTLSYEPGYITVAITDSGAANGGPPGAGDAADTSDRPGNGADTSDRAGGRDRAAGAAWLGPGGFGLAGIAERVASCGGNLTTGPTQAGGFAVSARLPAR
jgi:signal transduction histidine kinase